MTESLKPVIYDVKLTLLTEMLGSAPGDTKAYDAYIATKAPAEVDASDESEMLPEQDEDERIAPSVFRRLPDGRPCIPSYVISGFFKEACGALRRVPGTGSSKVTAYKKVIDTLVFAEPRYLPIQLPMPLDEWDGGLVMRPLRAQTAQGERIALKASESVPAGSTIEFQLLVLGDKVIPQGLIEEWLTYGALHGLGEWRSASHGRIQYEITKRS